MRDDNPPARLAVLDAFRAIAILAVLLHHYSSRWAPPDHPRNLYGYANDYPQWLDLGALGVQFFFMISGFVILMTLERCSHLFEFWARRLARLYPAYLAATLLTFAIVNGFGPVEFHSSPGDVALGLAFLTTFIPGARFVEPAYWSLVVEMQFYFWIGLLYAVSRHRFVHVWCAFVLCGVALWIAGAHESLHALRTISRYVLLAPYMPQFTAGILFYLLHAGRTRGCAELGAVALLAYCVTASDQPVAHHLAHVGMVTAFLLFNAGHLRWLAARPLVFIGTVSYSLYLLHQYLGVMLIGWLTREAHAPDLLAAATAALACVLLATLFKYTVEDRGKPAVMAMLASWLRARQTGFQRLAFRQLQPSPPVR